MVTVFGMRADAHSSTPPPLPPSRIDPKRRYKPTDRGDGGGAIPKRNNRRRDKKRGDNDSSIGGMEKKKMKKSKRASEY